MSEPPKHVLITRAQKSEGYFESHGNMAVRREFQIVRDIPGATTLDQTFVAINPKWILKDQR